jgi:hypothetical protein
MFGGSVTHGATLVSLDSTQVVSEHIPIDSPVPFFRLPELGDMRLTELRDHLRRWSDSATYERPFGQVGLVREGLPSGFTARLEPKTL